MSSFFCLTSNVKSLTTCLPTTVDRQPTFLFCNFSQNSPIFPVILGTLGILGKKTRVIGVARITRIPREWVLYNPSTLRVIYVWRVQGLRSARNRSLLGANEVFERKHNAEIAHRNQPTYQFLPERATPTALSASTLSRVLSSAACTALSICSLSGRG